ncbi:MAG TPA: citramalate synthase [Candidatus Treponema faecavium]|nr:citramalate synthase [Candidatus Treponema faecavium]
MDTSRITILDSTLRDGAQGGGISFSVQDKLHIVQTLDELGVSYIEAGNPGSNPKDLEFFQAVQKLSLSHAQVAAFGSTRRKDISCAEDANLQSLLAADTETVVVFGKTWDFHVTDILHTSLKENLTMIRDTVRFLKDAGRTVIYDAEHFFDAYKANSDYAMQTLEAAADGGACVLCLCETNGGMLPLDVRNMTEAVVRRFGSTVQVGIHTHNDGGLAVANSLLAVEGGALHVQGTILGFGERTGNANLSTIIADLELKMQRRCLPDGKLAELAPLCRRVAEIANITLDAGMPYVGASAFAHKAGMHIDAVTKNPAAYEHVAPELVGNDRTFLMSEVAGRSTILEKIRRFDASVTKNSKIVGEIVNRIKKLEHDGYQFEGAEGSFELLVRKSIGKYQPFFQLHYYKTLGERPCLDEDLCSFAQLKIEVDGQLEVTAGEGDGPVHALDVALRKALERFYPSVSQIRLTDYKVRVLGSSSATASKVRVLIESTDGRDSWATVGVSADIVEASWLALVDSFEYKLIKDLERRYRSFL